MVDAVVDRWRWTVDQYERAVEAGVFGPDDRVELLDGEVFHVPPMLPGHAATTSRIVQLCIERLPPGSWSVRPQLPIRLGGSEPEPDVCIAAGPNHVYDSRHPEVRDIGLVIEVSDTTLAFDRRVKLPIYAQAEVREVWIVSLPERVIHRFAEPAGSSYDIVETFGSEETLRARYVSLELTVDTVLPAP